MKNNDCISAIAAEAGMSTSDVVRVVNALIKSIGDHVPNDSFELTGLGTFSVLERPALSVRDPRTGDSIIVPCSKILKFKMDKELKKKVK